jgi:autotransporter-associated beta strand protein
VGLLTVTAGSRTTLGSTLNDFTGDILVTGADTVFQASVGTPSEVIPDASSLTIEAGAIFQLASNNNGAETINALNGAGIVRTYPTGAYGSALVIGGAGGSGDFSGVLVNGTTPLSITKTGVGTQILSGASVYTGATTVNDGTLTVTGSLGGNTAITVTTPGTLQLGDGSVTDDCWIGFRPTADNVSNLITGDGTATLNDAIHIDLSAADLTDGNSWLLVDVDTLAESYGANFEVTGFTEASPSVWTYASAGGTWTFTEATGILGLELSGYGIWAAANAPGQDMDMDHDNDGVPNGIEYFMGESGSGFTANPGLDATKTIAWPKAAGYTGVYGTDYTVQTSADLSVWDDVPPGDVTDANPLEYTLPTVAPIQFTRLKVTGP